MRSLLLLTVLAMACSPGPEGRAADTSSVAHDMAGMTMTGDADHDFLLMMSGHHKGLIELAHESMLPGSRGTGQSQEDARILDARQDRELEQMIAVLRATFQDSIEPRVTPDDQAIIDSLLRIPGPAYAPEFYRAVVAHHRQAVGMIDAYLPKARRTDLKALAERMRSDHLAEIKEFERKG